MIKREITICCEGFERYKLMFGVVLKYPFSLQSIIRVPFTEDEIPIDFCPFCGRALPICTDTIAELL